MRFIVLILLSFASLAFVDKTRQNEISQYFWQHNDVILDIDLDFYVNQIAKQLTDGYQLFLFNNPQINAFATEYGLIGIYSGLITQSENEEELLAVIAHEIGHIDLKHFARMRGNSSDLLTIGGLVLASTVGDSRLSSAIINATIAGNIQSQINWTRGYEFEADNYAKTMLQDKNLSTQAMSDFFSRLEHNEHAIEYLQTHPLGVNRAANSYTLDKISKHQDSYFYLTLKNILNQNQDDDYIQALTLFKEERFLEALELLGDDNLIHKVLKGRIYANLGNIDKAKTYLSDDNELSQYYLAKAYYSNNNINQAISILKTHNYLQPNYYYYEFLSQIYLKSNLIDKYHYTLAEQAVFIGDIKSAKLNFKLAKINTQDTDLILKINAKLDNL
jgi:predicted Zn-dependent protease